jgi:Domain of unknown function (DUF4123)
MTLKPQDADILVKNLRPASADLRLYSIVDAAANNDILDYLYSVETLSFDCLFPGDVEPDIFEVAPFLVDLSDHPEVLRKLLDSWGQAGCIYLHSKHDLETLQRLLRPLTQAILPSGEPHFFRFYDPRVMRTAVLDLFPQQAAPFFEGVNAYLVEGGNAKKMLTIHFEPHGFMVSDTALPLSIS